MGPLANVDGTLYADGHVNTLTKSLLPWLESRCQETPSFSAVRRGDSLQRRGLLGINQRPGIYPSVRILFGGKGKSRNREADDIRIQQKCVYVIKKEDTYDLISPIAKTLIIFFCSLVGQKPVPLSGKIQGVINQPK